MTTDYRAMCAELVESMTDDSTGCWQREADVIDRARALLALPTPEPVAKDAPLSSVTNCHISGPAPKPFTNWTDYFNHVQQSGVISGLKIEATLPTPSNGDD